MGLGRGDRRKGEAYRRKDRREEERKQRVSSISRGGNCYFLLRGEGALPDT